MGTISEEELEDEELEEDEWHLAWSLAFMETGNEAMAKSAQPTPTTNLLRHMF
jgi:hypothetical protein